MGQNKKQLSKKDEFSEEEIERFHRAAEQHNISEIESLKSELDAVFTGVLNSEISELEQISKFTESVKQKLKKHYEKIFPKRCNSCGTIYHTREMFLEATQRLKTQDTVFDEIGLQEYRNCPCGSTLIVWTRDRRDNSEYGAARRILFEECLQKLRKLSSEPDDKIKNILRKIFTAMS